MQLSGRSCLECEMIKQVRKGERQICIRKRWSKEKAQEANIKGGHIDVLFSNHTAFQSEIDIAIYSTYYTCRDHDALLITVTPKENKLQENKYMRRSDRILQQRKRKGSQEEQQKSKRQRLSNE